MMMQMAWFRDAPIKHKLLSIGLLTTALALLFVSLILTVKDIVEWRAQVVSELTTHARVISVNAASAMLFDDRKAAAETLWPPCSSSRISSTPLFTTRKERCLRSTRSSLSIRTITCQISNRGITGSPSIIWPSQTPFVSRMTRWAAFTWSPICMACMPGFCAVSGWFS